ncbi:30S ribosomal protein S8e [Candidatus Woesearchaeota archaeon]|nr:30S ribosomal protein S8e [Candidatus Woesearchaeota archaeon]
MAVYQGKGRTSPAGARYKRLRKIRKSELGRLPALTHIGAMHLKKIRVRGGNEKLRLLRVETANVLDQKKGSFVKAKILNEIGNPANRHFIRRNIITKGSIVETDAGKARITSRPGQDGVVNAVLVG